MTGMPEGAEEARLGPFQPVPPASPPNPHAVAADDEPRQSATNRDFIQSAMPPGQPHKSKPHDQAQKVTLLTRISRILTVEAVIAFMALGLSTYVFWRTGPLQIELSKLQLPLTTIQTQLSEIQIPLTKRQLAQVELDIKRLEGEEEETKRRFAQLDEQLSISRQAVDQARQAYEEARAQTVAQSAFAANQNRSNDIMEKNIRIQRYVDYLSRRTIIKVNKIHKSDISLKEIKIDFNYYLTGFYPLSFKYIIKGSFFWICGFERGSCKYERAHKIA